MARVPAILLIRLRLTVWLPALMLLAAVGCSGCGMSAAQPGDDSSPSPEIKAILESGKSPKEMGAPHPRGDARREACRTRREVASEEEGEEEVTRPGSSPGPSCRPRSAARKPLTIPTTSSHTP